MMMNMNTITLRRCCGGGGKIFLLLTSLLVFLNTCRLVVSSTTRPLVPQPSRPNFQRLIGKKKVPSSWASRIALHDRLRGGSTIDNDEEYDSDVEAEYDDEDVDDDEEETEDEYDDDEEEDEYDEEEEEEEDSNIVEQKSTSSTEYDEPYFMNPATQMYTTFGIIMLARKVDLFNPALVQIIRFAFIAQILIQQIFIIYVRIMAKKNNDRTPVTTQNPLSGVLQSQLGGNNDDGGGGAMMKNLASSFLSSQTTAMEYDMQQAKSMQSGVIFNMIFMWFLHFRMEQVQPLLIQATTGFMQLLYNPLFQVYILGRNLERPFKNPAMDARKKMMESRAAEAAATEDTDDKEAAENDESDEEDAYDEDEDEGSDEDMDDNVDEDDQDNDEEVEDSSDAEDDATS